MALESWMDDLLPTKWSRRVALVSIAAPAAAYGVPSLLPGSYLPTSPEQVFLLRLLLGAIVLLVGTLIVLALVVCSHVAQSKRIAELERELAARPVSPKTPRKLPPLEYDNRGIV
jgi:hypothetical protein